MFRDPGRGVYRRLVLEEGRLKGAVFYGDSRDAAWFHDLIREGADVASQRDTLIFGPAPEAGTEPDPYGGLCSLTG